MRYREWIKNPDSLSTMTKALVGMGLWMVVYGAIRAVEWIV